MIRPWMPLYIADYLADTAHLNATESGAYLHLIMHYWLTGGLPRDETHLARIAKLTPEEWEKHGSVVASFFRKNWRHNRIEKELKIFRIKYQKRASAGKQRGKKAAMLGSEARARARVPQPQSPSVGTGSSSTSVDEAAREAPREGKNGTASVCRVTYSDTERKALAFEFDGLDVDQAIAELDRWCDRKLINDPIDRKSAIYGGLRKRHGKAKLADSMNSPEPVTASPQLSASRMTRKRRVNGKHPRSA